MSSQMNFALIPLIQLDNTSPLNGREQSGHESEVVKCHEKKNAIEVALKTNKNFNKTFWFDNVFGPVATQRDIYVDAITPIGTFSAELQKPASDSFGGVCGS
jgi:hypothetical protein